MVIIEINNKNAEQVSPKIKEKRIKRYTPAVTKVEECTSAETGVGAAIAAGNQAEKGIWALLVIAANKTRKETQFLNSTSLKKAQILKLKSPNDTNQAIESKIHTSPTRLDKTVIIPALLDFLEG